MLKPNGASLNQTTDLWERPPTAPAQGANRSAEDIATWWSLIDRVIDAAKANSWTKTEVARRMEMPAGTFSQWFSAKYEGRLDTTNQKVAYWLQALEEASSLSASIPTSPPFVRTKIAVEIHDTLRWAQMTADMVMITLGAGNGKTMACRHYVSTTPHAYMATVSPHTKTVHAMLNELAAELDVSEHNPTRLTRAIGRKLQRAGGGTLLIIDEAQNLVDDAINQLRHFVDNYQCGIALVGNNEVYGRFSKKTDGPSFAQLKSRLGKRLNREKPLIEDLQTFIAAWRVTDPDCIKFLIGIGTKGGAMRQIDKTVKLASMLAMGSDGILTVEHLRAAWKNRDVEDMA